MSRFFELWVCKKLKKMYTIIEHIDANLSSMYVVMETKMATVQEALDRMLVEVTETRGAVASATKQIADLAAFMHENSADPAAIEAMATSLDEAQAEIRAAIEANPVPVPPTP